MNRGIAPGDIFDTRVLVFKSAILLGLLVLAHDRVHLKKVIFSRLPFEAHVLLILHLYYKISKQRHQLLGNLLTKLLLKKL